MKNRQSANLKFDCEKSCDSLLDSQRATDSGIRTTLVMAIATLLLFMMAWLSDAAYAAPILQSSPLETPSPEVETAPIPGGDEEMLDPSDTEGSFPGAPTEAEDSPAERSPFLDMPEIPDVNRPVVTSPTHQQTQAETVLDFLSLLLVSTTNAAAWIWLVCGSLIFFVVAGIVAGIYFSQRKRERYHLYTLTPDERWEHEVIKEETPRQAKKDEDIWPASLP
jgi:hypothetical protein